MTKIKKCHLLSLWLRNTHRWSHSINKRVGCLTGWMVKDSIAVMLFSITDIGHDKMLTTPQILDAAEKVLRKFGPRKTTVVDVARELNVSHGTVYRHFKAKADLHEAITKRWLERVTLPLTAITEAEGDQQMRLRQWFETLMTIKLEMANEDPEMFESYATLAKQTPKHDKFEHINHLLTQVQLILEEGVDAGVFVIDDCKVTARSLFFGTVRYHHPLHAQEWQDESIKADFHQLFDLLEKAIVKTA